MVRPGSDGPLAALLASLAVNLAAEPRAAAFAAALETIDPASAAPSRAGTGLPVLAWWDECLAQAGPPTMRAIAGVLGELRPALAFTQNPAYVASPPSPGFLGRYGYAVIAGPASGPPALVEHDDLAFGVLLLGPETTYPTHVHPAAELYLPLGPADWSVRGGPLGERPAGSPIVHAPNEPHITRTGEAPLAALYVWLGSLDVDARFIAPGVTPP
jgi:Dimethlysulfonioproprionate lyase